MMIWERLKELAEVRSRKRSKLSIFACQSNYSKRKHSPTEANKQIKGTPILPTQAYGKVAVFSKLE